MIWINAAIQAIQVPILSHDIVAVTIQTPTAMILIISAYDPNDRTRLAEQDQDLYQKLALVRQAIDETRNKYGEEVEVVMCSDLNRHDHL